MRHSKSFMDRHNSELQGARVLPQWLRNWRTPDVLLRLLSPIALLMLWELASFGQILGIVKSSW